MKINFFLFLTVTLLPYTQGSAQPVRPESSITVTASASAIVPPSEALVNFSISATGETISEANSKLESGFEAVKSKVNSVASEASLIFRGQDISPKRPASLKTKGANRDNSLTLIGPKEVKGLYAVRIGDLDKIDLVIDACLEGGASGVGEVELRVAKENQIAEKLSEQAAVSAKEKAQALVKTLGVSLGKLININVTDSRSEGLKLIQQTQGILNGSFKDQKFESFVTLSYEITSG